MDFFNQQDKARRKTKWLVIYFVMAVIALIIAVYAASLIIFAGATAKHRHYYSDQPAQINVWNPQLFAGVSLGVLAVIVIGSLYKTSQLSEGGSSVATLMGGRPVDPNTTDLNERKLLNVVEEMSIASGVPMPQVYVLDDERSINAFAAGHTTSDAAIGVTRGSIEQLNRDQLQGVIGHEFSHILNGDMRLNIRLISIIFGILCLATIGRILLRARGSGRDRNALPLLGLILLIVGSIGVFFGRLIQAAVSRQREFLADASSVQFTRNPGGLSGALQKIGRYGYASRLESEHAPDMCHMFFANGLAAPLLGALATHPPIETRIHAIDPTWDGKFPPLEKEQIETIEHAAMSDMEKERQRSQSQDALFKTILGGAVAGSGATWQSEEVRPNTVIPNLGNPTPLHLKYAEQLRESLPEHLKMAAREPLNAVALIYAMLINTDESERTQQIAGLGKRVPQAVLEKVTALYPEVAATATRARLPLVNIALPALRELTCDQYKEFSETLEWLISSDGKVELFEFVLQKIVLRHLDSKFNATRKAIVQYYTIKPLIPDCAVILSALANVSSDNDAEIAKAFNAGAPYLRAPMGDLQLQPRDVCGIDEIDAALNRLLAAVPLIKKNLIDACAHVIGTDGVILETEAELLRAIADTLDCPIPPLGVENETANPR